MIIHRFAYHREEGNGPVRAWFGQVLLPGFGEYDYLGHFPRAGVVCHAKALVVV